MERTVYGYHLKLLFWVVVMGVDEASCGQNTEMHWRPVEPLKDHLAGPDNKNSLNCVAVHLQSTEEEDKDKGQSEKQTSLFKL